MDILDVVVAIVAICSFSIGFFFIYYAIDTMNGWGIVAGAFMIFLGVLGFSLIENNSNTLYDIECTRDEKVVYLDTTDQLPDLNLSDFDSCYYTVVNEGE